MTRAASDTVPPVHDSGLPQRTALATFLRSPLNWLLLFIPLTIALEHFAHVSAPVLFFMAGRDAGTNSMAGGGWIGVAIPEEFGGGGRGITEASVVLEEVAASGAAMNGASDRKSVV